MIVLPAKYGAILPIYQQKWNSENCNMLTVFDALFICTQCTKWQSNE